VTCIGTMPRATAVIMAVGDNHQEPIAVGSALSQARR
jgi:hypothetical protein